MSYRYKDSFKVLVDERFNAGYPAHQNRIDELNAVYTAAEKWDALEVIHEIDNKIFRKADTLDEILEIFNDARKPMHIAEEEIYEILRSEQE